MKRPFVIIAGLLACHCLYSQTLAVDLQIKEYRKGLDSFDSLMQNGILLEDVSGLKYFTGHEIKTLYDWDQYFGAILQIYMGWPSDYIRRYRLRPDIEHRFNLNINTLIHSISDC